MSHNFRHSLGTSFERGGKIADRESRQNQQQHKKGAYLTTRNALNFEPKPASVQYKAIGWGVNDQHAARINHQAANIEKERIEKPTVRYLDSVKSSNFLNFLQTKRNEILCNESQDYWHPRMFYLTKNQSTVRNFQRKEWPAVKADLDRGKKSAKLLSTRRKSKHSQSVPPAEFQSVLKNQNTCK